MQLVPHNCALEEFLLRPLLLLHAIASALRQVDLLVVPRLRRVRRKPTLDRTIIYLHVVVPHMLRAPCLLERFIDHVGVLALMILAYMQTRAHVVSNGAAAAGVALDH